MIGFIVGTRPEVIKMFPVIKECDNQGIDYFILHTGQHYDYTFNKVFFEELGIREPDYNLGVGSGSQAVQTGKIMIGVEEILVKEKPDVVLVVGDTNSVLAGALSSVKLHIPVGHIEAGLRSYYKFMPEEINRILVDHCSDLLFVPTKKELEILKSEGIKKGVFVTGNTIVDAVLQNSVLAQKSKILSELGLKPKEYFLVTLHRLENVDYKDRVKNVLNSLGLLYEKYSLEIIFPIHPRTLKRIKEFNLKVPKGVRVIEPVGYFDFLKLEKNATLILTDSGGVQEEACILGVPCVTLRDNTERPETVEVGANVVVGVIPENVLNGVGLMINKSNWVNPFGDGKSAFKIVNILKKEGLIGIRVRANE